jgi:hypothetical protein
MNSTSVARWSAAALHSLAAATTVAVATTTAAGARHGLPRFLSETGLYSDPAHLTVDARNRAFAPQYPLWTDGAAKRRWVRLPEGTTIDVRDLDAWEFPVGTRFWKEFAFGDRRVETRLLVKSAASRWDFASYVWNETQTDGEIAPEEGLLEVAEVAPGKRHSIPSVEDCRACPDSNRTEPLGFTALQLSDDRDPMSVHADRNSEGLLTLRTLVRDGLMTQPRPELVAEPPRIPAASGRERAALGYLSANCGACHNTLSSLASLGLTFRQPAYNGGLEVIRTTLERRTKWDRPGAPPETTRVLNRESPDLSALVVRMKSRRPSSQMPPLGTVVPDHEAVEIVRNWLLEEVIGDRRREQ